MKALGRALVLFALLAHTAPAQGNRPPSAGGPPFPDPPVPDHLTVRVNCPGDSVQAAIDTPARMLTVEIRGICQEMVVTTRNHLSIRGGSSEADGLVSTGTDLERAQGLVRVFGGDNVKFSNLSFTGSPRAALFIGEEDPRAW